MKVTLVMFRSNGERRDFPLTARVTRIGRSEECALRIPLPEVSRRHSEIVVSDRRVLVRDLGSANGTYVNNKRIVEKVLEPGDHLIIGPVVFTVQIDGQPKDIRPVKTRLERRKPEPASAGQASGTGPSLADSVTALLSDAGSEETDPISTLEFLTSTGTQASMDILKELEDEEDEQV